MVQGTSRGVVGGWRECPGEEWAGTREFQEVGGLVQGGSVSEFLAHRLFEFLVK